MIKIDDFDYATYSSFLLGIGDVLWLSHDISTRGLNIDYAIVGGLFLIGNVGLIVGLRKHYKTAKKIRKHCKH